MSLITRYILREAFASWLVVVAVLFVIFMANQFADILGDAAADRLPKEAVFAIFGLTSLRYLALLIPIALFLGVMLALARLNRDGEMAALSACGIGPGRLLVPITALTLVLAGALGWLALSATPQASQRIEQIKRQAEEDVRLDALQAGRFTSPDSGNTVLYAGEVVGDELRDVFSQSGQGDRVVTILAERGERVVDAATGAVSFVLYNGRRYEGVPGDADFVVIEWFDEHGIPIRTEEKKERAEVIDTKPTAALLRSSAPADRAELQWRISMPISLLVLGLLAVPLSRSAPREGRYGRLGIGLLVYLTYSNLIAIARLWVEREMVPDWVGMWWVHVLVGAFALLLLGRASGWLVRARPVPV